MEITQNARNVVACIAWHLAGQRARSRNAARNHAVGGHCLYRDAQGRKCAVGVLIPDSLYRPDLEIQITGFFAGGKPSAIASGVGRHLASFFGGDENEAVHVLASAQYYHDAGGYEDAVAACPEGVYSRYQLARRIELDLLRRLA